MKNKGCWGLPLSWTEFREQYGEKPEDFFDDPALYWDSRGDHARANKIRADRRKIKNGEKEEL